MILIAADGEEREREIYGMAAAICLPIFSFLQIKDFFSLSPYRTGLKGGPQVWLILILLLVYHFCLDLPAAFTQPGARLLA